MNRHLSTATLLLALACAPTAPPSVTPRPAPAPTPGVAVATAPSASSLDPAPAPIAKPPAKTRCETIPGSELGYTIERALDQSVSDFAVGTAPTVAALSGLVVSVFDGKRWKALPAFAETADKLHVHLFFGRDNAPRLMGFQDESDQRSFYLRFKNGRFQPEPSELGPLGSARGPLYGVLGFTDPEVVCKPREVCLVKRISGWARVPAHEKPVPIFLGHGGAFAFNEHTLERLDAKGFVAVAPAQNFEAPKALWADPAGAPWVLDSAERAVFHLAEGSWQRLDVPLDEPAALWGKSPNSVWIVGKNGALHFDGKALRCVAELTGPLGSVMPAGETLWLSGGSGVFRAVPIASKK